jgi:hypothetical protein
MIKKYNQFILETFNAEQNDPPEIASDMNTFNDTEDVIKEFNNKKVTVNNIYMTYKDEKDLINKLSSQKFIDNTNNKKSIKFQNPLLGLWAQSCEKRREIKDINDQVSKWNDDIKDEQDNIKNNPSMKDSSSSNIQLTQDKIKEKNQQITKLQMDVVNLEKLAKDKLKKMTDDINSSKKRIDLYRTNKFAKK